jgi:hypothetical protein
MPKKVSETLKTDDALVRSTKYEVQGTKTPGDLALSTSHDGDINKAVEMLNNHATKLDQLFGYFLSRAMELGASGGYPIPLMRLALKAQSQARASLETVSWLKNPTPTFSFIKQQNVGINQQVNNESVGQNREKTKIQEAN